MVLITRKNWGGWGWGSWTVETIVAWQGITVDSTDPANPIVSSTWTNNPSQFDSIEWWYVYYAETDTGDTQITRYDLVDYHRMVVMWERDNKTTLTYYLP